MLICQRGQKHLVAFPMWCPPWHPLSQFLRRLSPVVSPHMPTPGLMGRGSCFKSEVSNDTLINERKKKKTPHLNFHNCPNPCALQSYAAANDNTTAYSATRELFLCN